MVLQKTLETTERYLEEEIEMYEQYRSVIAITKKVEDMIIEIDLLESKPWF